MPRVAIFSLFYNRSSVAARTMKGICGQTYPDFEAYVIDDGSTDDTLTALSALSTKNVHVEGQPNNGFTKTLIDAIDRTDSDYIAIVGSGDYSHPTRIARQVEYMDRNRDVGALGCYCNIISEVEERSWIWHADIGPHAIDDLVNDRNPIIHGCAMIRRSTYDAVGGYRSFFTYRQDLDLWLRIAEVARLANLPEILYDCYKLRDSVSENVPKLIAAKACRDFAVHCSRERRGGRPDPLDKMGPIAALLRPRSRRLAKDLAYTALKKAIRGNKPDAKLLLSQSLKERPVLLAAVTNIVMNIPGVKHAGMLLIRLRDGWKRHQADNKLRGRS
jgi:hypothetical protein